MKELFIIKLRYCSFIDRKSNNFVRHKKIEHWERSNYTLD